MALSDVNGSTTPFPGNFLVEGVQTVSPAKPTDQRKFTRIHVPQGFSSTALLQRRFHVLLCYRRDSGEDSGWAVAGRMRESLSRALEEEPLIAGRMRCRNQSLWIESTDSGVRLVEVKAEMSVDDLVEMEMEGRRSAEAQLVCWEEVVEANLDFSPLFYLQVTNFSCDGYSIGISCSFLLVDPFRLTTFIKKWSKIHNKMFSNPNTPTIPTFYLPLLGKSPSSPSLPLGSNTFNHAAETLIFELPTKVLNSDHNIHKNIVALCIDEAEHDSGNKLASNLSLFSWVSSEDAKVEVCSRKELLRSPSSDRLNSCVRTSTWDELELKSVCFNEGKKPVYVSCWINSLVDEGSLMLVPLDSNNNSGSKIVVAFT